METIQSNKILTPAMDHFAIQNMGSGEVVYWYSVSNELEIWEREIKAGQALERWCKANDRNPEYFTVLRIANNTLN